MEEKQGTMDKVVNLDSIEKYCDMLGLECSNPMVCSVNLKEATQQIDAVCNFGFYALFLKHIKCGELQYGMTTYDYDEGTVVCIGPNQVVHVNGSIHKPMDCDTLMFSPSLIQGTSLAKKMQRYSYFAYTSNEALHLSEQEQAIVKDCMNKIAIEVDQSADLHSRDILVMNIELLLEYCLRFYDRQFDTRQKMDKDILARFEKLLNEYLTEGIQHKQGLPTVKYFADKICLSPNYFGDMVKKLTGRTAQDIILGRIVDMGKEMILGSDKPINDIAYDLGFLYPQHFTRFFKNRTGMTPLEFRKSNEK